MRERAAQSLNPEMGRMGAEDPSTAFPVVSLVDTHLHLEELGEPNDVVERAVSAGVTRMIAMGVDLPRSRGAVSLANRFQEVWAGVGHYPLEESAPDIYALRELAADQMVVAIGEIALDWDWAERFLDLGFYLSFAGLITRPSRTGLRDVVTRCPADRLLLETDSPYGNAQKRMGVPNRPEYLLDTAEVVAELRGVSLSDLAEQEKTNAYALFPKMK